MAAAQVKVHKVRACKVDDIYFRPVGCRVKRAVTLTPVCWITEMPCQYPLGGKLNLELPLAGRLISMRGRRRII